MRKQLPMTLEAVRVQDGPMGSDVGSGPAGMFRWPSRFGGIIAIISSGVDMEYKWEHVSASLGHRTPNWGEMCMIKDWFWEEEEVVIQYHPAKSEYVNHHPHCLHLWRPIGLVIPTPPTILIGPKS